MHFIINIYNHKCTLLSRCKLHIFVSLSQSPVGVHQFTKKNYQEDKCGIRNSHCLFSLVIIVHFHLDASFISLSRFPRAQLRCNQSALQWWKRDACRKRAFMIELQYFCHLLYLMMEPTVFGLSLSQLFTCQNLQFCVPILFCKKSFIETKRNLF